MNAELPSGLEYLDESAANIEEFEGRVHWLYLDSDEPANVTTAIGFMLPNVRAAQAIPFRFADGTPASFDEVEADFERVAAMEGGHLATFYLTEHAVRISDTDIEGLLMAELIECDRWMRKNFTFYGEWPKAGKLAAIDMRYNLGPHRFLTYPRMIRALLDGDWLTAAKECDRNIHMASFAARNYWTRCHFLDAAKATPNYAIA